jgi:hypothetical protein
VRRQESLAGLVEIASITVSGQRPQRSTPQGKWAHTHPGSRVGLRSINQFEPSARPIVRSFVRPSVRQPRPSWAPFGPPPLGARSTLPECLLSRGASRGGSELLRGQFHKLPSNCSNIFSKLPLPLRAPPPPLRPRAPARLSSSLPSGGGGGGRGRLRRWRRRR